MKHGKVLKKIMSLMLAVMLVLGMGVMAMAAPGDEGDPQTFTITAPDNGHTYEVYQIFTGEYDATSGLLSTICWGANSKWPDGTNAGDRVDESVLKTLSGIGETSSDIKKLEIIQQYVDFETTAHKTVSGNGSVSVAAGYYLIKDTTALDGDNTEPRTNVVMVVKNVTISEKKTDTPELDKKVKEGDDYVEGPVDHNIGDDISFKLVGGLPGNYLDYSEYKYVFKDTMSAGLTLQETTVKVSVENADGTLKGLSQNTDYKLTVSPAGTSNVEHTLTIEFDDLKKVISDAYYTTNGEKDIKVVVQYDARLNDNAVLGGGGNPNDAHLEFTNNPGDEGEGKIPDKQVLVFTYELDGVKYDKDNSDVKLENAEFKLYREKVKDNGEKVLEWVTVDANNKVTGWSEGTKEDAVGSILKSNNEGKFSVIGLDAGTYYLLETKAPLGYNLPENPFKMVIHAKLDATKTPKLDEFTLTIDDNIVPVDGNKTDGSVTAEIANAKGSTLPETGGIGTTIFYILGGILVLGCGVILVTRKRVSKR